MVNLGNDANKTVSEVQSAIAQKTNGLIVVVLAPSACAKENLVPRIGFSGAQMGGEVGKRAAEEFKMKIHMRFSLVWWNLDHRTSPDAPPCWTVTLPTRTPDGRHGTDSSSRGRPTRTEAVTAAALRAQTPTVRRHRRGAHLDLPDPA